MDRLLLLSAYDSVGDAFYAGIRAFGGNVYLAYGARDPMAALLAQVMGVIAPNLRALHVEAIPDCDHGFRGATNARVLSKAYRWAFAGDASFPSAEGGLALYGD